MPSTWRKTLFIKLIMAASVLLLSAMAITDRAAAADQGILVLGGTRATGFEIVRLLHERSDPVASLARTSSDTSALEALGVEIVIGDAFDRNRLEEIMLEGNYRAVISTMGGPFRGERKVDFEGNRNGVDAAKAAGIGRFILVTMIGSGDSLEAVDEETMSAFREMRDLKTQAEDYLMASGLEYTIVRPGGLQSKPATGNGFLTEDRKLMGSIHRADLAQLVIDCLDDDDTISKVYSVADKNMVAP